MRAWRNAEDANENGMEKMSILPVLQTVFRVSTTMAKPNTALTSPLNVPRIIKHATTHQESHLLSLFNTSHIFLHLPPQRHLLLIHPKTQHLHPQPIQRVLRRRNHRHTRLHNRILGLRMPHPLPNTQRRPQPHHHQLPMRLLPLPPIQRNNIPPSPPESSHQRARPQNRHTSPSPPA